MTEYSARRDPKRKPMHPGKLLREVVLPALNRPKSEIAKLLGVSRQTLYETPTPAARVTATEPGFGFELPFFLAAL